MCANLVWAGENLCVCLWSVCVTVGVLSICKQIGCRSSRRLNLPVLWFCTALLQLEGIFCLKLIEYFVLSFFLGRRRWIHNLITGLSLRSSAGPNQSLRPGPGTQGTVPDRCRLSLWPTHQWVQIIFSVCWTWIWFKKKHVYQSSIWGKIGLFERVCVVFFY